MQVSRPLLRPALALASLVAAVFVVSGLSTAAAAAGGTTWWVDNGDPRCPYTGAGTPSAPFCTIGAAAAVAMAGDTVLVRTGTYREEVKPSSSGSANGVITFSAAPGATVTVTGGAHGFTVDTKSWVTISGFTVSGTTSYGIYLKNASHVTVQGNRVTQSGQPVSGGTAPGIYVRGTTDSLVVDNTADHNSDSGIYLTTGTSGVEVRHNVAYANARQYTRAAPGIDVRSPDNTIDRNVVHDNEDSGIQLYNGANGSVVFDNLSYGNGDHGIDCLNSTGVTITSNSVYGNKTAGINLEGAVGTSASTNGTVRNNISVDNGLTSSTTKGDIRVDASSTSGTTIDSDDLWLSSSGTLVTWGSTLYSSLTSLRAATGQEAHGVQADPEWVAPGTGNFHLTPGSPAIDSADSGAPAEAGSDLEGNARVDDPSAPNTGLGPRPFDDRGAFELAQGFSPAARLTVTPSAGAAPLAVTADASGSTAADAPIASYRFDFGDGASSGSQPGPTATHTYTAPGSYTVTVTVTDTAGHSDTATATVSVSSGQPQNLVGNPGFETGTNGWNNNGRVGITVAQSAGGHAGSFAAVVTNTTSASAADCTLNDSPNWVGQTDSGTYTASMWVRADNAGATLRLRLREYAGSTFSGQAIGTVVLGTAWQQVTVSYVPSVPGGSTLDLTAYTLTAPPGTCFYADDASITLG
jgi:parallel beta-helix repeat protein